MIQEESDIIAKDLNIFIGKFKLSKCCSVTATMRKLTKIAQAV